MIISLYTTISIRLNTVLNVNISYANDCTTNNGVAVAADGTTAVGTYIV